MALSQRRNPEGLVFLGVLLATDAKKTEVEEPDGTEDASPFHAREPKVTLHGGPETRKRTTELEHPLEFWRSRRARQASW